VSQGCRKGVARVSGKCREFMKKYKIEHYPIRLGQKANIPDTSPTPSRHLPDTFPTPLNLNYLPTAITIICILGLIPDTSRIFSAFNDKKYFLHYKGREDAL